MRSYSGQRQQGGNRHSFRLPSPSAQGASGKRSLARAEPGRGGGAPGLPLIFPRVKLFDSATFLQSKWTC
jgi:hypothetical protein